MEEENTRGNMIIYLILQISNMLIGLFGIGLLILSIYLCINIKGFNSFALTLMLLFILLTCITIIGLYSKSSPTLLILYFLLNMVFTVIVIVFTIYLFLDLDNIVDYMTSNMKDNDAKIHIKEKFESNLNVIRIVFLSYILVFVIITSI